MNRTKYNALLHGTPHAWDALHKLYGGGGSSTPKESKEARRLYAQQADTAEFMLGLGKEHLPTAVTDFAQASQRYKDPAYKAGVVGEAVTNAQTQQANATAGLTRDMARYGINPASGKFGSAMNQNAIQGAAMAADAANVASRNVDDKQLGAAKDFYNNLAGMPSDAAATAGQAASGYAALGANKQQAESNAAAGWGSAIGQGVNMALNWKDGGEIRKEGLKMAVGGVAGRGLLPAVTGGPRPIGVTPVQDTTGGRVAQGLSAATKVRGAVTGNTASKIMGGASKGMGALADLTGSQALGQSALQAAGAGTQQAASLAAQNVGMGQGATALTAEALGSVGAQATSSIAAASSPALSAISTAVPWLGAAVAVGSLFDLFADGGEVERKDMTPGGPVEGPGTETSDDIPAWLSDGEFVINAESVKMPGVKPLLEKINQAGLTKRYGSTA